jgi:lipopolysaccharide biosynthesis glycosyltransferase
VVVIGPSDGPAASAHLEDVARGLGLSVEVRVVELDPSDLPVRDYLTKAAYYKLLAPLVCGHYARLICLDADMVALRDPSILAAVDLGDHCVAAVQDLCHPVLGASVVLPHVRLGRGQARAPYCNSGLLVIDVERWRKRRITARALAFARERPQSVRFLDQCALNFVLKGKWVPLDARWNVFPMRELVSLDPTIDGTNMRHSAVGLAELEESAFMMHYATALKPWKEMFPAGRNRDRYANYV